MIKKNKILKFFLVSFLPGLFLLSCVEDFEAKFELQDRILVIEGVLSDIEGEQYVTIRESIPSSQTSSYFKVISKAKVFVTDNTGNNLIFSERESGYYYPETGFKGEIGRTYQLEIELNDGTKLESDIQKLTKAPAIKNVYKTIDPEAVQVTATKTLPGHKIYVDYDDPKGVGDNYLWTWTLYEKQDACKTCYGGLYYRDPKPEGYCQSSRALSSAGTIYDYSCEQACWEIIHSKKLIASNDRFTDGLSIKGREVADIPFYNEKGGLLEIKQQSVSAETFNYLQLLISQGQNTGSLADTPPAALVGNITNISNKEQAIGGYFMVTSISKSSFWIDRSNIRELGYLPYGLLEGRSITPEPQGTDLTRPPLAPCLNSYNRTNQKPIGFQD